MRMYRYLILMIFLGLISAQDKSDLAPTFTDFQISSERYMTDDKGNIMMYVNIWGHVSNPGHVLVYEGIDMATLLSWVGGPMNGADLKNVKLFREVADKNGRIAYDLNFNNFIKNGDRSEFIEIKPNDTIFIPQKFSNIVMSQVGAVNTVLGLITLYLQVKNGL